MNRSRAIPRLAAALALVPTSLLSTAAASATVVPEGAASHVSGVLPGLATAASPAQVTVAVEPDLSHLKVGQTVHLLPVASKSVIGSSFSIALPRSPALAALAGTSGDLNVVVRVATAHGMTTRFVVVRYGNAGAASGNLAAASVNLGRLSAYLPTRTVAVTPDSGGPPGPSWNCNSMTLVSKATDVRTRIGELHAAAPGVQATYEYHQSADSTFTVGIQGGSGPVSASGSVSITTNTGSTAGYTRTGPYRYYVNSHYDFSKFKLTYSSECGYVYQIQATGWDSDAFPGDNESPGNPYGGCEQDPHGYATLPKSGYWNSDRGTATSYDAVATVFAFSVSGHTGYSTNNHIGYVNNGVGTYICGNNAAPNAAGIIYNSGT